MKKLLLSFIVLLACPKLSAQVTSEAFNSQKMNETRRIAIYTPEGYDRKQTYPLLVVLDADHLMEPVIANARYYDYFQDMPDCIIVGVYNEQDDVHIDENIGFPMNETAQFFEFIGGELVPYIEGKYSTNKFRGIIATNESANFANYFLLKGNSIFNAYLSVNPTPIQGINESVAEQLRITPQNIFYYMATSDLSPEKAYAGTQDLNSQIRSKSTSETADYYFEDFKGASPNAVVLTSIPRAFDLLFDSYKPISVKEHKENIQPLSENIFDYIKNKYSTIEKKLNIKKKPLMNDIMAVYSVIVRKKDWDSLLLLSEFVTDNGYKDTAMPSFFLAEYYEEIGEPKKSLRAYQKAYTQAPIDFITTDLINERINALKADFGF
ncbi:MAG: alpha/beta hydrolase-fold protein [Capnocytophaga sp.]|nr:alpha/beta hydrolase-fold protein [Capnocytophaga sp.]